MATLKIGFFDLVWYDRQSKQIVGDMGFTFCDCADSRFPADELQEKIKTTLQYHCRECYEYEIGNGVTDDFAIYELHTAEAICEDSENIFSAELDIDTDKVVAVFVCATKADAESIILAHYGKDIKAYYIED